MQYAQPSGSAPTLKVRLEAYERQIIEEALQATRGNQRRAARALGVLPTTLHEKMKRLGLLHREAGTSPAPTEASAFVA